MIISRDTQEVHPLAGYQMAKIINSCPAETSILDDFYYFETKQGFNQPIEPKKFYPKNKQNKGKQYQRPNVNKDFRFD